MAQTSDDVTFEDADGILVCRYSGPFELEAVLGMAAAISETCARRARGEVLVDLTRADDHGMTVPDRYRLLNWIAAGPQKGVRVAVVARVEQGLPGDRWRAAAAERDVPIRVFADFAEAREWLVTGS